MYFPALSFRIAFTIVAAAGFSQSVQHRGSSAASASSMSLSASDSVDFVELNPNANQRDCNPSTSALPVCRVRGAVDRAALEAMLAKGISVAQAGDEIVFVQRSNAKSMTVTGGLQYPLSRVVGTDIFTVKLRARNLDRAVVSYAFYSPDVPMAVGATLKSEHWRGASAPPAAAKSTVVHGTLRVDTLPSRFLSSPRVVHSYVPPARGNDPIAGVVYMGDGDGLPGIAAYIDTLVVSGKLPRVMLVGSPSGRPAPNDPPGTDVRSMEYLFGYEPGNARYLAHERFMVDEVMPWAEATLGAPSNREQRAVWGVSNSGGWAVAMGLRHPDKLGVVFAFSPAGSHGVVPPGSSFTPAVRFFLHGGTMEPTFHRIAADWNDSLRARGVQPNFREVVAGHDWLVWCEQLPAAIRWAWVRDAD